MNFECMEIECAKKFVRWSYDYIMLTLKFKNKVTTEGGVGEG